jgi:protein-disulfide isomerase
MSFTSLTLDIVGAPWKRLALAAAAAAALAACGAETAGSTGPVDMSKPRAAAGTDFSDGYEKTELGWAIGAKDAPVTLVEYASFTCGGCGGFYKLVEPKLKEEFIDTGFVRFEFRSYIRNQADMLATQIAECVGESKIDGIKNLYFSSQYQWLNSPNPMDYVAVMAKKAGVNSAAFRKCTGDAALRTEITKENQQASMDWSDPDGAFRTPTLIVNNAKVQGGFDWENLSSAIERALRS